jgi:selenocysteine lyase/cysteine desulfurase
MLTCQRDQFDMPREICFFNAAAFSPLPKRVQEAAHAGVDRKARPWRLDGDIIDRVNERARRAAARLIQAEPNDVALVSSVGYGVATAGKVLDIPRGSRVLVLANDHTSPVLEWMSRAESGGFTVEVVERPGGASWTEAILDAIEQPGASPLALASISNVHWSDGGLIDLDAVAPAIKRAGAALLIDATHAVGMMDFDVGRWDPDFVCFPTYKWLLGPYGRAFVYVAKRHQDGVPLEQTSLGRKGVDASAAVYFADTSYLDDARRFDMGERDHFISMDMAATAMEMVIDWGPAALGAYSGRIADQLADHLTGIAGIEWLPAAHRTPHLLCLDFPDGMPQDLPDRLAQANVFAAPRLGRLRISPHIYNDETDVVRFAEVIRLILGSG